MSTSSSLRRTVAACAALLAGLGVATASARADVVERSSLKLEAAGFDFGDDTFKNGAPKHAGDLTWTHVDGEFHAHLVGTLHMDDVKGACANMRMDYRDASGATLATIRGGQVCVHDSGHHQFGVDLDEFASGETASVRVSIEATVDSTTTMVAVGTQQLVIPTDPIEITTHGVDLGDPNWDSAFSVPGGPAPLVWEMVDGGLRPHLVATIHLNNAKGTCARVNLRYYDHTGALLAHEAGGPACTTTNDHDPWSVDLDPYTNSQIDHVKVQLETQNRDGSWSVIGHDNGDIAA